MLKPRQIAAALPDVTPRRAGDWLRGDRLPSLRDFARILDAFPDVAPMDLLFHILDRHASRADQS